MSLKCRKVGIKGLGELLDLRMEFIQDIHPEYGASRMQKIRKAASSYFRELLGRHAYIGFTGSLPGKGTVCSSGLLLYSLPPLREGKPRKIGHVLNFFTKKAFRKKGFGLKLMAYMKKEAKKMGLNRLVLNSTMMGYPLYKKAGFTKPYEKAMKLDL